MVWSLVVTSLQVLNSMEDIPVGQKALEVQFADVLLYIFELRCFIVHFFFDTNGLQLQFTHHLLVKEEGVVDEGD